MGLDATSTSDAAAAEHGPATPSRERRADPRVAVCLRGVCSVAGGPDASCRVTDLSLGGAFVACDHAGVEIGLRVSLRLPAVGLLGALVARASRNGFAVAFDGSAADRRRVERFLAFVRSRQAPHLAEARGFERIVPLRRIVDLRRSGEPAGTARIVDVSRSGAALTTTIDAPPGTRVVVGQRPAAVVRRFADGVAVEFETPLPECFDASIVL